MPKTEVNDLTRREREVLYIVYEKGNASVSEIQEAIDDASYNAVRRILDSMLKKGLIQHRRSGRRYLYSPAQPRVEQGTEALREVLNAFFGGSAALGFMHIVKSKDQRLQDLMIQNVRQLLEESEDAGGPEG